MAADLSVTRALSGETLARINRFVLVTSSVRGTVHTVNNILQAIGGQAELLGQRDDLPADVPGRVDKIAAQTVRAADLMRELSSLGRETPGASDRVDVRRTIDRVYAIRQYDLGRAQIQTELSGEPAGACVAAIDAQALMLVVLNLLLNAEQALAGRTGGARIVVSVEKREGQAVIAVADNGPGVPPDHEARLFEAFFTTGRTGATLGLGLTVSRLLAEEHGGRLSFAGTGIGGHGARFEVALPAIP
jgi:signal transduction histidine kinase